LPHSLLRNGNEPDWSEVVFGDGAWHATPRQLDLMTRPGSTYAFLALDRDPQRRWFDYSIDLKQMSRTQPDQHQLGIFFGWRPRPAGADGLVRCFLVQLDERPGKEKGFGQVRIGTIGLRQGSGHEGQYLDGFRPLPDGKDALPVVKSGEWHHLRVRALDGEVAVTIDRALTVQFSMDWLRSKLPGIIPPLDPCGDLGIWTREGIGFFRNATVAVLPSERAQ
jgi:hypothetical protein